MGWKKNTALALGFGAFLGSGYLIDGRSSIDRELERYQCIIENQSNHIELNECYDNLDIIEQCFDENFIPDDNQNYPYSSIKNFCLNKSVDFQRIINFDLNNNVPVDLEETYLLTAEHLFPLSLGLHTTWRSSIEDKEEDLTEIIESNNFISYLESQNLDNTLLYQKMQENINENITENIEDINNAFETWGGRNSLNQEEEGIDITYNCPSLNPEEHLNNNYDELSQNKSVVNSIMCQIQSEQAIKDYKKDTVLRMIREEKAPERYISLHELLLKFEDLE